MIPAYKTNVGANKQSYCMINGLSMTFVGFQIGTGGCRDGQPLTVNRNNTSLPGLVAEFDSSQVTVELASGTAIRVTCIVPGGTLATNVVSNIGIIAKVVGEPGTFLYAISNFSEVPVNGQLSFSITLNN